ncbi:MAG: hypothetical protein ABIJ19_01935 [Patescibacteria group bacterium]
MNFFSKVICVMILILFLTVQTAWAEEPRVIIYFSRCPDITLGQSLTENNFILEPNSQQTFFLVVGLGFPDEVNRFLSQIMLNQPIAGQSIIQIGADNVAAIKQRP